MPPKEAQAKEATMRLTVLAPRFTFMAVVPKSAKASKLAGTNALHRREGRCRREYYVCNSAHALCERVSAGPRHRSSDQSDESERGGATDGGVQALYDFDESGQRRLCRSYTGCPNADGGDGVRWMIIQRCCRSSGS